MADVAEIEVEDNIMEDQVYNTGELTYHQKENFKKFLDDVIGTDFEEESFDGGKYTLTVFDLTPKEVRKIREFENTKINEPYEKFCAIWKLKDNDTIYRSGWLDSYDEADDLMANVSTTFGVDKFRAFDFRMVETSIKSEQYRKENVASAKEVSTGDLMRNFKNLLLIDKLWAKEEPIVCDLGCVSIHFKKIDNNARQIEVKSNSREFDYVEYQLDKNYNFEDRKYKTSLEAKEQLSHIYLSVYKELDSKETIVTNVYNITSKGNLGSISGVLKDGAILNIQHSGYGIPLDRVNRECEAFKKAVLADDKTKFCTDADLVKSPKGHVHLNPDYLRNVDDTLSLASSDEKANDSQSSKQSKPKRQRG